MQLIYCYIKQFRNIEEQEIQFSDKYNVSFNGENLMIREQAQSKRKNYVYGDDFMRNLYVIVGKTGSGKTNLLQMLGMDTFNRGDAENKGEYLMLYQTAEKDRFVIEIVGLQIPVFASALPNNRYSSQQNIHAFKFTYQCHSNSISNVHELRYEEMENTHIINAFDRYSFAYCPYPKEHKMDWFQENGLLPRMAIQYGKSSISMECTYLQDYLRDLPAENVKRKASLVIRWDNWQDKIQLDLDERLLHTDYWTYKSKAEKQREDNIRKGNYNKPIEHPKGSTPKSRFIHDLMTDFAIYLRKWAEIIDGNVDINMYVPFFEMGVERPDCLPDRERMSILKRIDWLCQYLDYHTDGEMYGNRGLIWQEGSDVIDLFRILNKMDEKYFTDEEFSIPVVDIDLSEGSAMSDLFERMEQYRADEVGVFTEQLLPYHWTCVSSGEYQYAKIWGILEAYGVKIKTMEQGTRYEEAKNPNIILLLDEPESYMHPEMCRCFIHKMSEILKRRYKHTDFQVILSTHSPFMLSDVLSEQVIRMDYDELGKCKISQNIDKPYFAANIHSIMANGFFLTYTIGEQARIFLSDKFRRLKSLYERRDRLQEKEIREVRVMHEFTENIGDDMIRYSFENLIRQILE